jgi:7,8-dihydro-6-hydroxymethylpterin-pyrophosphokinase
MWRVNIQAIFIFCCVILSTSCTPKRRNNLKPSINKPNIKIKDAAVTRKNIAIKIRFYVDLSASSEQKLVCTIPQNRVQQKQTVISRRFQVL